MATPPPWLDEAALLPVAFAQVREDALLDRDLVAALPGSARVLLIASGGCTAAVLAALPNVTGLCLVDANPAQLALTRLKLHLLAHCPPTGRLALLGHAEMPTDQRRHDLEAVLAACGLTPDCLGPPELVAALGPDQAGRYERLFAALRIALAPVQEMLHELLCLADPPEQVRRAAADTLLGRALDAAYDDVLALPNLVRLFGEGATRNRVEPFARHFARRTRHALATLPAATNPYLWQMLVGCYPESAAAPWLALTAPARIPEVEYVAAPMTAALASRATVYDFVHLSNILDWLTPEEAGRTLALAAAALRPGGLVFVRQLNSTLDVPAAGPDFDWQPVPAAALHRRDRSFFYRALHLGVRR